MTLRFEGYIKSPDGFGTGTYEVLHPKGASIEITRSLFEGDVLQITSVRNTPDPALEKARRIRLYDENKKLFDGYLRAPDYRRGSNSKLRRLFIIFWFEKPQRAQSTQRKAEPLCALCVLCG